MSSSRAILYASSGDDFAATARSVALTTRDAIVGAGAASAGRGAKQ
jgi:orotidine-5'-phosphate decarboxylase